MANWLGKQFISTLNRSMVKMYILYCVQPREGVFRLLFHAIMFVVKMPSFVSLWYNFGSCLLLQLSSISLLEVSFVCIALSWTILSLWKYIFPNLILIRMFNIHACFWNVIFQFILMISFSCSIFKLKPFKTVITKIKQIPHFTLSPYSSYSL